ncbi:MAG: type I secretion protein TolC [Betaproteobacteria bacterium HGW-Betaproteobacteria-1]|nr:MAG: type I secretion protein TolC [Betaproteobacteria bacterium HGW-Betaproteobacteria-1]
MLFAGMPAQADDTATQDLMAIYQNALSQDPSWASSRSANLAAQEKLEQGKALYRPTVTLNSDVSESRTTLDRDLNGSGIDARGNPIGGSGSERFDSWGYSLNVTQPLFRRDNFVQYQQSKLIVSQADRQLMLDRQNLMLRVTQAYFDVLLAQDSIELINAQKSAISNQLEQAKANFEVGTATITDVNEAQARFDLTTAQEIAAINQLEIKKRALQSIIGKMPQNLATVREDLNPQIPEPTDMQAWVDLAEQNSLALAIQQHNFQIANREVERMRAGHMPTLDAVARYSDNRNNGSASGFASDLEDLTVGLQLAIPIYQGGAVSSRVREAAANLQKAQEDMEVARRQADLETRQAYLDVSSGVAQIRAYEQALLSSQSQLDSTNLGYEVGVRTSVDVLNAQQQFFTAKRDLLQARYNYLISTVRLKFASGILTEADLAEVNQQLIARN